VVGHRPFGVAIHADTARGRADWRADYAALTYHPIDVPDTLTAGMTRYLNALGLSFGAFDFVVTPDNEWVMLECNPAGQWLWLAQAAAAPGTDLLWPTSSSTMPSLMARMLGLLQVAAGHRALEIGTGTGYHAALLCHRLGDTNVASIDIDPTLVEQARARLARCDWHPHLAAGDGTAGIDTLAPYDRIIATCAVPAIPPAWIRQLGPDSVLVADVRGEIASSLAVLRKTGHDTIAGPLLAVPGHFMWLRRDPCNPLRDGGAIRTVFDHDDAEARTTDIDPASLDDLDLKFVVQLHLPDLEPLTHTTRDGRRRLRLRTNDGSWAEVTTSQSDRHTVTQDGPRRLWDHAEHAARHWHNLGRPTRDRYGLTATTNGTHHYWLDQPDNPPIWTDKRPGAAHGWQGRGNRSANGPPPS